MKNHIEQEQPNKQFFNYIVKLLEWNTFIASYSYFVFLYQQSQNITFSFITLNYWSIIE